MGTENLVLRPNGAGDVSELAPVGDTNGWECVDEETSDDDSTYVTSSFFNVWKYDLYALPNHTDEEGTINSVRVYWRAKKTVYYGDQTYPLGRAQIKTGGTVYEGADAQLPETDYTLRFHQWTNNPKTSSAWTWDDIDALQAGVGLAYMNYAYPRCTQVYVEIDYTEAGGEEYEISCSDGLLAGDSPSTIGSFHHTLSDGVKLGDSPSAGFIFPISTTDGLKLGDSPTTTVTKAYYVEVADGVKLSDTPTVFRTLSLILSDGLKAGDTLAINRQGRGLLIRVITTKYRLIQSQTAKYRDIKAITTEGGKPQ